MKKLNQMLAMVLIWTRTAGLNSCQRLTSLFLFPKEQVEGELYKPVKVDGCFWSIEDGKSLSALLTKHNQMEWWKSVIKGDPEVDAQNVEPENSKLSDLDPGTRQTLEKMMVSFTSVRSRWAFQQVMRCRSKKSLRNSWLKLIYGCIGNLNM